MHIHSNNVILAGYETDDIIKKLFDYFLEKYKKGLEEKMKTSNFNFDSVGILYYKVHKTSLDRGGSYRDSPEWLKNEKARINPKNKKDDKCFQYAISLALNYQIIHNNQQEVYNIKPFIDQYDWNGIDFPSNKKYWNKFELNNKTIARNVLFIPYNTKQIKPEYISKYNLNRKKISNYFSDYY